PRRRPNARRYITCFIATPSGTFPTRGPSHPVSSSMKAFGPLAVACLVLLAAGCGGDRPCGVPPGAPSKAAARGLRRDAESVEALGILGLHWSADPHQSDVLLLGYPDLGLTQIAAAGSSWTDDASGLHHTYGEDFDGSGETCNGDLHQLLE